MTMHLERDLDKVRKHLLILGDLVGEITEKSIEHLLHRDPSIRLQVDTLEAQINDLEVDIEEECLKILALHQPVAIDLRFIVVVMKVTNDLERMGDQAVNISHRATALNDQSPLQTQLPIEQMSKAVQDMVTTSLDCLLRQDADLARKVVEMDDIVDDYHAANYSTLRQAVLDAPESVGAAMSYATVSSNLERVADLCTNIAEEVLFMIDGRIVRHHDQV